MDAFFQSGEAHFRRITQKFDQLGFPLSHQGKAIDYGCGVGRVLRPMADYFDGVTGIDVARSMLHEAEKHLQGQCVILKYFEGKNIEDCLGQDVFKFIHSAMVFQHIRPRRGMRILEGLLQHLDHAGTAFIQLPIYAEKKLDYWINQIVTCHPALLNISRRLLKKKQYQNDPAMQYERLSAR